MNNAIDSLREFTAIESVSTDPTKKNEIKKAVEFLKKKLLALGFTVKVITTARHPLLYAVKNVGAAKTVAFYSHYDVQPSDPLDKWNSPPFELAEKNGKLVARGVADDKGHIIQTISAIEKALSDKTLNTNIVLVYEGEEEIGSINFETAIKTILKEITEPDVFYILDSGLSQNKSPMILYGLRGMLYYELTITAASHDLHSGLMGNLAPNPANILATFIASLKDKNNHVTLPHFYANVPAPTKEELANLRLVKPSPEIEIKGAGIKDFYLPKDMPYYAASKCWPSFDVNGLYSGFTETGVKTIIPAYAFAKFSFRLVQNMNPAKIDTELKKQVKEFFQNIPVDYKLTLHDSCTPFSTNLDNEWVRKTATIFEKHFGKKTLFNRSGGTISAAEVLARLTQKPIIITGFTSSDSNLHGPDENIDIDIFYQGIAAIKDLIS